MERKPTAQELVQQYESLAQLDWRLLHWLLHYPLQRADDLVVGVARWASRATVYRHVQELQARGLLESILPKTPGVGKRLYHLSNSGLHVVAMRLESPARDLAHLWRADEAGLLRLLPRLPTLLVLQDVVNGLVDHAAEVMTTGGRRPRLVRWTWQRDVTHRFRYREQPMHFFADGMVALCVRTQQIDGSTRDEWYGLFLLFTELDDERIMRLRLERLLCWRESPEHWSSYQHMPPVLILARSPRQCDHWQRAIEAAALKLRVDPLAGALACLPQQKSGQLNPWLLNWRMLSIEVSCHLQDLLAPLPTTAFPLSLGMEGEDEERDARSRSDVSHTVASSGTPIRLRRFIVGDLSKRAARIIYDELEEHEVTSLLGLRLTPCQWNILRLLLAHPLLSDEELAAFLDLQRKSVRCSLYDLHQLRCLESVATEVGKRWHLCERGLRLITTANHLHIRNIAVVSDDTAGGETPAVAQRGEAWLLERVLHTAGIYGFFARLIQSARRETGNALCWWETGALCERRYQVNGEWYNLRPDALAAYGVGQKHLRFWLEWDRGTMNVRDLSIKFTSYAHYIASRQWARESSKLPRLLCITPDIAQERRLQRAAQAGLARTSGVVVWTTTEVLLNEHGPLAPIWMQQIPARDQGGERSSSSRQSLFNSVPENKGAGGERDRTPSLERPEKVSTSPQ